MNRAERRQQSKHLRKGGGTQLTPEAHRMFLEAVGASSSQNGLPKRNNDMAQSCLNSLKHPDTLHLRGMLGYQQGDYQLALNLIQQAIEGDSTKPHYYFNMALAFEKIQRWDDAIASLFRSHSVKPSLRGSPQQLRQCVSASTTMDPSHRLLSNRPGSQTRFGRSFQ